jgi:hypothetical protein
MNEFGFAAWLGTPASSLLHHIQLNGVILPILLSYTPTLCYDGTDHREETKGTAEIVFGLSVSLCLSRRPVNSSWSLDLTTRHCPTFIL